MYDVSQIDRNFLVKTSLDIEGIQFYDIQKEPFSIYGVFYENGCYRRLPQQIAETVSPGVLRLHNNTAGGRLKFTTDSPFVAIKAAMPSIGKMPHFALTGSAGFDLYVGQREEYYATFSPPFQISDGYESVVRFPDSKLREITIHFPLYSSVSLLYIGLDQKATVKKSPEYRHKTPVVFYGSSITQGGCASRAGNAYPNILSRMLNTDHVNLGFSGNAKAEDTIAQYISGLPMSVFVYDYDHNAPTLQHLQDTHQKMFRTIRQQQPDLPIVLLSRPKYKLTPADELRLAVIEKTYHDAIAAGDRNVYFIPGPELMKYAKNEGTVDGCHPTDFGFYSMAKALIPQLKALL